MTKDIIAFSIIAFVWVVCALIARAIAKEDLKREASKNIKLYIYKNIIKDIERSNK